MRRRADFELAAAQRFERLDHPQHLRRIGAEALLVAAQRPLAEAGIAVQHRQHGQADAGRARRGDHPFGRFGRPRIQEPSGARCT